MRAKCPRCGEQDLVQHPTKFFRIGLPWLNSLAKTETPHMCVNCGMEVRSEHRYFNTVSPGASLRGNDKSDIVELFLTWSNTTTLNMHGALRLHDRVFVPNAEGHIQGRGSLVDRFGDPDLMADMAREYLRQFWILLPKGRLPNSLKELMPALLLLVTSAEQALKAFGIRAERFAYGHSLKDLYDNHLGMVHKIETERLFRQSEIVSAILENGQDAPTIEHFLWPTPIRTDTATEHT